MHYLIVGTGSIGSRHVRNLAQLDKDATFTLLRTNLTDNQYVTELKKELPGKIEETTILSEALEKKPDGALICNPTSMHLRSAIDIIPSCKNILIEKPLSHNLENTDMLVRLSQEYKANILIAYNMHFSLLIQRLKDIISKKELGEVLFSRALSGSYLPDWRPGQDYSKSYSAKKELGGGPILDLSHEIDYMYWLFGKPEQVQGVAAKVSNLKLSTEDIAEILLTYPHAIASIHLDFINKTPVRTFDAAFSKGHIHADIIKGELVITQDGKSTTETFSTDRNDMFLKEAAHFIAIIKGTEEPRITLADGLTVLEICLQAGQKE
ncbi:MAG: Gfo/Idh/MocA family oxidoreductase [Nanoarchaeota archaeon]